MSVTRRRFIGGGITAFTVGLAAPSFLGDLVRAQAAPTRNLVVLYLGGGNDALSFLVPYTDTAYYDRRPTLAVPAESVLPIGSDSSGTPLGLHPNLTGLRSAFDDGQLAIIQRTGYADASRSHFRGSDIWSTARPASPQGTGWLGRYLDSLLPPLDPLVAWNTASQLPRSLQADAVGVPSIPDPAAYVFATPNPGTDQTFATAAAAEIASHVPVMSPHLSFVNATAEAAFATLDRVETATAYAPTVDYPPTGLGQALLAVAAAIVTQVGTQVFWVQTGGYDTHAGQSTTTGRYAELITTLDEALFAFYADLRNHALLNDTLLLEFSEFGRRVDENGSQGTDHGAAGLMMALGGRVAGGLYGTSASLSDVPGNSTLENGGRDVAHETDFRSVYARVIDDWLGVDSSQILDGDFRDPALDFV